MQHAGTLRKRSRRTINANGLRSKPYNETEDHYSNSSFKFYQDSQFHQGLKSDSNRYNSSNKLRITRQPFYHDTDVEAALNIQNPSVSSPNSKTTQECPYLLSNASINRLRYLIFVGGLCFMAPWTWDRKTNRIRRWSPFWQKIWKIHWYLVSAQSVFMGAFLSYTMMQIFSRDLESYRGVFAYAVNVSWYVCHLLGKMCMLFYEEQIRKYINRLLDFNEESVENYMTSSDEKVESFPARLIIKFAIPAAASQQPNALLFFFAMPYLPLYLTSRLLPGPWYLLIPGAIQDFTLSGQTMLTYSLISWLQIAHTSSIEFWLREMHRDSDSDYYTSDELRTPQVSIRMYRRLQIVCCYFNECMSPMCMPVWNICVAGGFIPCGYLWFRSMNETFVKEFPGSMVYPFGTLNCFIIGYGCLKMTAEMFDVANSYIYSWSRTKHKDFRRVLMSFSTVRIQVGRYYYISATTTVQFFQILTGYIIDCLLTFP